MRSLKIIFWVVLLEISAADLARADESPSVASQVTPDAGPDGGATPAASDGGVDGPDVAPVESQPVPADAGLADLGDVVVHPDAGLDTEIPPEHLAKSIFVEAPAERGQDVPVIAARATAVSFDGLPLLGVMVDVGVPDGLMASLVARPWSWMRVSAGGGTNSISNGWRAGISLLPSGAGPSASLEYGRYQDGDANALAKKFVGGDFNGSPALDRVGYEFMNAHLGLDFGSRNVVFFVHGGVTMLRGQIHNLDAAIAGAGGTGTTEVVVRQDPNFKASGPSFKLGLLCYIW
jgi:hypothetical protein